MAFVTQEMRLVDNTIPPALKSMTPKTEDRTINTHWGAPQYLYFQFNYDELTFFFWILKEVY